jgi:hypothetical protein
MRCLDTVFHFVLRSVADGMHDRGFMPPPLSARVDPVESDDTVKTERPLSAPVDTRSETPTTHQQQMTAMYKATVRSIVTIDCEWTVGTIVKQKAYSTGFIVSADGYIVTAAHSIKTTIDKINRIPDHIFVTLLNPLHREIIFEARVVGIDARADVAMLHIKDVSNLPALHIEQSYTALTGQDVAIIGNTFGIDPRSMATGTVRNARWKDPIVQNLLTNILTTVPTADGCSGAPILTVDGSVLGIHTAAFQPKVPLRYTSSANVVTIDPYEAITINTVDQGTIDQENESMKENLQVTDNLNDTIEDALRLVNPATENSRTLVGDDPLTEKEDETGALNISTANIEADLLDEYRSRSSTTSNRDDQDSTLSTVFGGGLVAPLLYKLVHRWIQHDQAHFGNPQELQKCMPRMSVIANTVSHYRAIRNKLPKLLGLAQRTERIAVLGTSFPELPGDALANRGYIITAMDDSSPDTVVGKIRTDQLLSLMPGDIVTHIDNRSVGTQEYDDAIGDATWFLEEGEYIKLTIQRFIPGINPGWQEHHVMHNVTYLPTEFDRSVNDSQNLALQDVTWFITSVLFGPDTMNEIDESKRESYYKPTNVSILKVGSQRPLQDIEIQKLPLDMTFREDMTTIVTASTVLSVTCMGKQRYLTIPIGAVFDGDSLKRRMTNACKSIGVSSDAFKDRGSGWLVHDHVCKVHRWDDGDPIPSDQRWLTDEIMYDLLSQEDPAHVVYAKILKTFDFAPFNQKALQGSWDKHAKRNYKQQHRFKLGDRLFQLVLKGNIVARQVIDTGFPLRPGTALHRIERGQSNNSRGPWSRDFFCLYDSPTGNGKTYYYTTKSTSGDYLSRDEIRSMFGVSNWKQTGNGGQMSTMKIEWVYNAIQLGDKLYDLVMDGNVVARQQAPGIGKISRRKIDQSTEHICVFDPDLSYYYKEDNSMIGQTIPTVAQVLSMFGKPNWIRSGDQTQSDMTMRIEWH